MLTCDSKLGIHPLPQWGLVSAAARGEAFHLTQLFTEAGTEQDLSCLVLTDRFNTLTDGIFPPICGILLL